MEEGTLKQRSYKFALDIIKLVDHLPNEPSCWVISKQVLRSATSVGANIVEAQGASSTKDFINFYSYALKSAHETVFWLCLLRDSGKFKTEQLQIEMTRLINEMNQLSKMLAKSILTLKQKIGLMS